MKPFEDTDGIPEEGEDHETKLEDYWRHPDHGDLDWTCGREDTQRSIDGRDVRCE